ncbi:hypothetical protein LIER_02972 [Lithospermum erythrorhizon]|uniref:KxDL domain-containing protein n=1 Tax=Lithospermum erythrorhizon TaxID=34254 RepID=A0AAV3NSM8_LITER
METSEKEIMKSAAEEISNDFKRLVNTNDLASLKHLQHLILGRIQDSNAVLSHFNDFSENCFTQLSDDFQNKTRLLKSIKADLDYVFQKLRSMKSKISATYPDALPDASSIEVLDRRPDLELPQ